MELHLIQKDQVQNILGQRQSTILSPPLKFIVEQVIYSDKLLCYMRCVWRERSGEFKKFFTEREPSYTVGGNVSWCSHCGKKYGVSSEN